MYEEDGEDEASTEEDLLEQIREQKDLIEHVKCQPWTMAKKMKILKLAKGFVEKHEGRLSKSKGYQQKGKQIFRQLKRTWGNLVTSLVPWEMKIKRIESHFGSVVVSYFVFLRWLIWVNVILTLMTTCFIVVPELIAGEPHGSNSRKTVPDDELDTAADLKTIWNAGGIMRQSLLFYGYYGSETVIGDGYRLPLAYLICGIATFAYSFIVVLKRMASNSRQSRLSNKDEQFTFSWKLYTDWDFMVANPETAKTKHASIITTFREAILEEKEKTREEMSKLLIFFRVLANVLVLCSLALSAYIIQLCVERGREVELRKMNDPSFVPGFWDENELTIIMTLISTLFPNISDLISLMEKYHPRTSLRLQLARIFALNLLNLYTLFIALYNKQNDLKAFATSHNTTTIVNTTTCYNMSSNTFLNTPFSPSLNTTDPVSNTSSPVTTTTATVVAALGNETLCKSGNLTSQATICWETMIGQEIFKLTVMDLVFTMGQIIVIDVIRGVFIRYCNSLCCWDMEKTFPEYPDFKTAENLLHLINNQGMVWIGTFFAPGLPILNLFKLLLLVYVRCWTVLVCNVPQENIFRASRSNNFYYALSLIMLFLCMLPPLFSLVVIEPSPNCGPFSGKKKMYHILTETMETELPQSFNDVLDYVASPGVILPVFMLLCMTIYYLISVGKSLKDANNELRMQLEYERTEGRRKVYAMADAKRELESSDKNGSAAMSLKKPIEKKRLNSAASNVMAAARLAQMMTSANRKESTGSQRKISAGSDNPIPVAVVHGKRSVKGTSNANKERERKISKILTDNLTHKSPRPERQSQSKEETVLAYLNANRLKSIESKKNKIKSASRATNSSDDSVNQSSSEEEMRPVRKPPKVAPKVSQKPKISYINEITKRNRQNPQNDVNIQIKSNIVRAEKKRKSRVPKIQVYDYSQDSVGTNEPSDDVMDTDDTNGIDTNKLQPQRESLDIESDEEDTCSDAEPVSNSFASVLARFQR
ncbi:hypothetical protein SNE40_022822 [Patella caerulea]|uniref:TMC domain-containing protein n=1 Tax=Patella caerulea TaxID=87958 RepID=A0AAN8G1C7_PATCE